jgi:hypothetical protein
MNHAPEKAMRRIAIIAATCAITFTGLGPISFSETATPNRSVRRFAGGRRGTCGGRVVVDDILTRDASGHAVVDGAVEFDAESSRHASEVRVAGSDEQAKARN